MKKKIFMLLFILPIILTLVSCGGNFENNVYRTMYTVGVTYDTGMKSVGDMYQQGKLTQEQLDTIMPVAHKVATAYQATVTAFAIYNKTKAATDEEKVVVALTEAVNAVIELQNLIREFMPNKTPEVNLEVIR